MRSKKAGAPPVPPQRHSSMRPPSITSATAANTSNNNSYGHNNSSAVSRLVTDLESKFGKRFHNVTEFPTPPPFLNIQKMYPSRNAVKATNAPQIPSAPSEPPPSRKQRAPAPPIQAKINAYAQQQMENQQW